MEFTSAIIFDIERMGQQQSKRYKAKKGITQITTAHNKHHHLTIDHAFILRTQLHPIHPPSPFLDPNPLSLQVFTPLAQKEKEKGLKSESGSKVIRAKDNTQTQNKNFQITTKLFQSKKAKT
jgi:hypothetical protein